MIADEDAAPAWRRYLRFWRSNSKADVREELEFHLQSTIEELVAAGWTIEAARDAARNKFGDVGRITRTLDSLSEQRERTMARAEWWDTVQQDIVFGLRQLRKAPAFTAVAVLTLALGVGATSAIFSIVYSVLLRPLPYTDADRVLALAQRNGSESNCCLPHGNFLAWRSQATGFEAIGAIWGGGPSTLTGVGDPTPVVTWWASAGYWKALFVPPVVGRYYDDSEDRFGGPKVAVLSYALWQHRFGGDPAIVGRTITLNSDVYTVVGVAPPSAILQLPAEQIWTPLAPAPERFTDFADHELRVYGKLKAGVNATTAVRQLTQIETSIARQHPHSGYDGGVTPTPLIASIAGSSQQPLYLLLGAVVMVLLIACGNIANLLLARANVRRTEIAVRGALGATRGRIVGQLLVESILLAVGGGALGIVVAAVAMRFLVAAPFRMPRLQDASLNLAVVLFALGLTFVCAVLFGLVPAIRAARLDLQKTLRDGGRESRGTGRDGLRRSLVASELCVAEVLLIGAGLLIRSSIATQSVAIGFDTRNLLAINLALPSARYDSPARVDATFQQIEESIAAIPGVKSVGRTQQAPIAGFGWDWTAFREGSDGHDAGAVDANMRYVSPNYFSTLSLPLLRGRAFTTADGPDAPKVAIVSRNLAQVLWPNEDPIGKRIADGGGQNPVWREVVGVVGEMHASGPAQPEPYELYRPSGQTRNPSQTILIRGQGDVSTLMPSIRRVLGSIDPLLAPLSSTTIDGAIQKQLALPTFSRWLLTLLGLTGLVLAAVGVYGVIAYLVAQRTHEFGVRMALGSDASALVWLVVRQGFAVAALGIGLGLVAGLAATHVLSSLMFGVSTHDPLTFGAVGALLAVVAALASLVPALRATRIDPLEALRGA